MPDTTPVYPTAPCDGCKAPVIWAVSARTGARMPIDATPVDTNRGQGNILLTHPDQGLPPKATVVRNPVALFGRRVYRSHFTTCPHAGHYRGRAQRKVARP